MAGRTRPFAAFEWMIAWRYLRAKRAEGGVSIMTWISLIGVSLAVFALIATLAVRSGFRAEFVDTILGANAHVTVYNSLAVSETGATSRTIADYDALTARLRAVPGVTAAAPLVRGQVMGNFQNSNIGMEIFGINPADLLNIPRIAHPDDAEGDLPNFANGIAIGSGIARELGINLVYHGALKKLESYDDIKQKTGLLDSQIAYVGDDVIDVPVMRRVIFAAAPADALIEARNAAHYVTSCAGGRGAVREVCDLILKGRGLWEEVTARYEL